MKIISYSVFIILNLMAHASSALDLDSFHGVNLNPIGYGCGIHLEVSNSSLIVTNIIPPRIEHQDDLCRADRYAECRGQSIILNCDKSGKCMTPGYVFQLLEDGNVISVLAHKKFAYSNSGTYYFCTNN